MASRVAKKIGALLAAIAGLVCACALGWARSHALTTGVLHDAAWVRALEAGQRLDAGHVAGVTFESTVGPAQQGVAAIALLAGPSTGATILCAITSAIAVLGALSLSRETKGAARTAMILMITLLALRADVLALPGLVLLGVALEASRERARPRDGWRLGALMLVAVAWSPWSCIPAGFVLAVAARWRPKLAVRAAAVLTAGVLFLLGLSLLAGSLDLATWLAVEPSGSGMWALVVWLLGSWLWIARRAGLRRAPLLPMLLAASTLSLLVGHDPFALVWPLAAGAALLATSARVPRAIRSTMALGATVLVLAEVVAPVLRDGPHVFAVPEPTPMAVEDRLVAWMDEGEGCVASVGDIGYAAVRSRASVIPLDERVVCPRAVLRGPSALTSRLVLMSRHYEAVTRLGMDAYGLRRRDSPAEVVERTIAMHDGAMEVPVDEVFMVPMHESLSIDALVRVTVEVESGGAPPSTSVRAGDTWVPLDSEGVALVPVRASATLARWMEGRRHELSEVDHLELRTIGRPLTGESAHLRIRELVELVPPASEPESRQCVWDMTLEDVFTSPPTGVRPIEDGYRVTSASARVEARVPVCGGVCFLAEVGVIGDAGSRSVRFVEELDGRARTLVSRTIGPGYRQPIEVRLRGGELALSLLFEGEGDLALHRPRIARCASLVSVVNPLHERLSRYIPDDVGIVIEGDELRIPVLGPSTTPARVELDIVVPPDPPPCMAVELSARGRAGQAGLLVGVERDAHVYWLSRLVLPPNEAPVMLQDLELEGFVGHATLVFSTWPIGSEGGGVGVFTRPRVHECGERPGWAF